MIDMKKKKNDSNEKWSKSKEGTFTIYGLPNCEGIFSERSSNNKRETPLWIYNVNLKKDSVINPVTFKLSEIERG